VLTAAGAAAAEAARLNRRAEAARTAGALTARLPERTRGIAWSAPWPAREVSASPWLLTTAADGAGRAAWKVDAAGRGLRPVGGADSAAGLLRDEHPFVVLVTAVVDAKGRVGALARDADDPALRAGGPTAGDCRRRPLLRLSLRRHRPAGARPLRPAGARLRGGLLVGVDHLELAVLGHRILVLLPEEVLVQQDLDIGRERVRVLALKEDDGAVSKPDELENMHDEPNDPSRESGESEGFEIHKENLAQCDAVLIYYGNANQVWFEYKRRDLKKIVGLARKSLLTAEAVYVASPKTAHKQLFNSPDTLVIKNFEDFSPAVLESFVARVQTAAKGADHARN